MESVSPGFFFVRVALVVPLVCFALQWQSVTDKVSGSWYTKANCYHSNACTSWMATGMKAFEGKLIIFLERAQQFCDQSETTIYK